MVTPLLATEAPQTQETKATPKTGATDAPSIMEPLKKEQKAAEEAKPTKDPKPADQEVEQKTDDSKPADEKKADEKKADDKPIKKAPERYEFKVPKGLPDGHELDATVSKSFQEIARSLDLSNDDAQRMLDSIVPVIHRRSQEMEAELHQKWIDAVKADKLIGGDKLDEKLAIAKRGRDAFGDPDLHALLDGPLGSHPAVLRAFYRIGLKVQPDSKLVTKDAGPSPSGDPSDPSVQARKLYPDSE